MTHNFKEKKKWVHVAKQHIMQHNFLLKERCSELSSMLLPVHSISTRKTGKSPCILWAPSWAPNLNSSDQQCCLLSLNATIKSYIKGTWKKKNSKRRCLEVLLINFLPQHWFHGCPLTWMHVSSSEVTRTARTEHPESKLTEFPAHIGTPHMHYYPNSWS